MTDVKILMKNSNSDLEIGYAWLTFNLETFTVVVNFGYSLFTFLNNYV